ncbi:16S rRNA (uracil1498-N3)-methyltransferase [Alkalithermobacter thermoalcaliphilus JW-YL-7 = DSM 7308]|uniref:Ribosomal RNA small subunit methyltransferase E n=1 Tax=Alkalithermobacter thermoalcaliphilus JW-YL-7 = DSM 7308 TaxID=1121328 RepID=A0A150FR63_CLOPD|nr:Ribosomal RNA small subunit methyltransferase E [[Clostridium] paradoxum JW-YL-7 = DSM 7308]SHL01099.1 16S rRNA (uracil1498-N3)-methyltransferase [[Clostridium] paradoxum JW-YL-7 = DSM 7308]
MDRFFVDASNIDIDKGICIIEGEDVKHISKVLRYGVKDKIEVCDKNNNEYICEIIDITKTDVTLKILQKVSINREPNVKLTVYQGLPKGQKLDIIIQKLTEIGVSEIVLVTTKRSVAKIDEKKEDKKLDRWQRIAYEAAKQSKRGIIPKIKGPLTLKQSLEDMKNNDINIVAYENESENKLKNIIKNINVSSIGIFIGPEGGFDEEEIEKLKSENVKCVGLGPRILRTETASIVLASILLYELSDLGGDE